MRLHATDIADALRRLCLSGRGNLLSASVIALAALLLTAGPETVAYGDARNKPNVVIILVDDMGYADTGFTGCTDIPTPNLDRLAAGGLRCTQGYVSHPFCSPTRAGLMTGRYQQRFGHENNPKYDPADEQVGLPLDQFTVAQAMQQVGYATGAIGKWHLGAAPCFHPNRRGFAEYYGMIGGGHDYFKTEMEGSPKEYFIPMQRNSQPEELKEYLTDALSREAVEFVRRHRGEPFFLYLAYNAPHAPLQASEKYLERFQRIDDPKRKTYAAMVSAVDDGVGLMLNALAELKLESDTLIFFLSDNGGPVGEKSNGSSNRPLRAGKGSVYEGGIHVPFAIRWPARLPAGKDYDQPVCSLDIFPTSLAAAGGRPNPAWKLDGTDLLPYLTGQRQGCPHERLFWRTGGGATHAVRAGDLKLAKTADSGPSLFDLRADLSETRPLENAQPQRVAELSKEYEAWNSQLVPPRWESPRVGKPAPKKPRPARPASKPNS